MHEISLALEIRNRLKEVQIDDADMDVILQILEWKRAPAFPFPGRTAWHILSHPAKIETGQTLRAAKLKGVGLWNPPSLRAYSGMHLQGHSDIPNPPSGETYVYTTQVPHFGIDREGQYCLNYSAPAPLGGITFRRAKREYDNALILWKAKVPTVKPFLVIAYPIPRFFNGAELGAVVTLSEESSPYRLHPFHLGDTGLHEAERNYYIKVQESMGITGPLSDQNIRLNIIKNLAARIGKLMHDFSAAGLYRHSGGLDNFQYSLVNHEVFLTDLDSSRRLDEINFPYRPLHILRDIASCMHKLLNKFYHPSTIQHYSIDKILLFDPLVAFLSGFFPKASQDAIRLAVNPLWSLYLPHYRKMREFLHRTPTVDDSARRHLKVDMPLFYVLTITSLYRLYRESDLAGPFPAVLTDEDLLDRASALLGDKADSFRMFLDGMEEPEQPYE